VVVFQFIFPAILLVLLSPTLGHAEEWDKLGSKARFQALEQLSGAQPMNWGAGGAGGINYGGESDGGRGEPRKPQKQDAAAPSSGNCLGVCFRRTQSFQEVLSGKPTTAATQAEVAQIHEAAGQAEYNRITKWSQKNGVASYEQALANNAVGMKTLIQHAHKYPGGWIGLKSPTIHHAVQVFEINGKLAIVDPNIAEPMFGEYTQNGFEWSTIDGKRSAKVDFAYLPAYFWP